MKRYVYRLVVEYPPTGDFRKPFGWLFVRNLFEGAKYDFVTGCSVEWDMGVRWPRNRTFLSSRAAYDRANLFEQLGCRVRVERSEPVTWDERI